MNKAGGNIQKKGGKDDDSDDPIAQAMKLREKFGGPTAQVPAAEAKKLGLVKAPSEKKDSEKPVTKPKT